MSHHVHVGGLAVIAVLATVYAAQFLIRTAAAHHANNPAWQGLVYGF